MQVVKLTIFIHTSLWCKVWKQCSKTIPTFLKRPWVLDHWELLKLKISFCWSVKMDFYWILQPNSAPVRRNCCRSCSLLFIAWSSEDHNARKRYSVYIYFLYIANQWKKKCVALQQIYEVWKLTHLLVLV